MFPAFDDDQDPLVEPSFAPPRLFGRYLVEEGLIEAAALDEALELMSVVNRTLGQLATARGLVTPAEAERVNALQRRIDGRWGEIALAAGFGVLEAQHVETLMAEQSVNNLRLSDALVELGYASASEVDEWWARYDTLHGAVDPFATLPETYRSKIDRQWLQLLARSSVRVLGQTMLLGRARPWLHDPGLKPTASIGLGAPMHLHVGIGLREAAQLTEDDLVTLLETFAAYAAGSDDAEGPAVVSDPLRGLFLERGVAFDAAIGDATGTIVLAIGEGESCPMPGSNHH